MTSPTQPLRKARPILFSGAMIRALLEGRKTQTRRIVKPQPVVTSPDMERDLPSAWAAGFIGVRCPYGVPGDVLWAREGVGRWSASFLGIEATNGVESAFYKADGEDVLDEHEFNLCPWWKGKGLPSIHMPRWASRLTLEITDVRVERLQDISEEDAQAEGASECANGWWFDNSPALAGSGARGAYYCLWEYINGPGSWDANPWVWAISFRIHRQNVDAFLKTHEAAQ